MGEERLSHEDRVRQQQRAELYRLAEAEGSCGKSMIGARLSNRHDSIMIDDQIYFRLYPPGFTTEQLRRIENADYPPHDMRERMAWIQRRQALRANEGSRRSTLKKPEQQTRKQKNKAAKAARRKNR